MITDWEQIRGSIPERIKDFEARINSKQERMNVESDFAACCRLNAEIADLASRINDLHLWFRTNQDVEVLKNHS